MASASSVAASLAGPAVPSGAAATQPSYRIDPLSAVKAEGDSGTTDFTFLVTRSGNIGIASSIAYGVPSVGPGLTPVDFAGGLLPFGTLNFAVGETQKTITILVAGDTTIEADETLKVNLLQGPIVMASAFGTILSDDLLTDCPETVTGTDEGDVIDARGGDDTVHGLGGNDRLMGGAGNDTLNGGAGNDRLDGGMGRDVMAGCDGDDTYVVDHVLDKVIEKTGEGIDTVEASIDWTLGAAVENLTLTGSARNGTGNDLGNLVTGNAGNNMLKGLGGVDTLRGLGGSDTYHVEETGDVVVEEEGAGTDRVYASASYTLSAHVEDLVLTGTASIDGTGNDLANKISGNSGVNTLLGGAGADTLTGFAGADTMDGGEDGDVYYADRSDIIADTGTTGRDRVVASGTFTLGEGSGIEDLLAQDGVTAPTLTGNALANQINGNGFSNYLKGLAGADILTGLAGTDRLEGGAGRDSLIGGADADTFVFRTGDSFATAGGFDTVVDFLGGTDKIDLDVIGGAGLPIGQYGEVALASTSFAALLGAAQTQMAGGGKRVVFVAGQSDGWLFWSTDGLDGTAEAAVKLTGQNGLASFSHADLM